MRILVRRPTNQHNLYYKQAKETKDLSFSSRRPNDRWSRVDLLYKLDCRRAENEARKVLAQTMQRMGLNPAFHCDELMMILNLTHIFKHTYTFQI